jgi:predicted house-cleaning noncanonical NTP pyrophosphatase (MazG superfamily)
MKTLKITRDEIIKLIENSYKISKVKFMTTMGYEPDCEVCMDFEYIEGELK